jgi:hypothetical protein
VFGNARKNPASLASSQVTELQVGAGWWPKILIKKSGRNESPKSPEFLNSWILNKKKILKISLG